MPPCPMVTMDTPVHLPSLLQQVQFITMPPQMFVLDKRGLDVTTERGRLVTT